MDKSCANHPESMALATCKACDKSICLMCVVDEKEGTFCSSECHAAFVEGREVPKFVESAAEPASVASSGAQKIESIFDDGPSAPAAPASSEGMNLPPSDDPMPIVAEGTKWRSIGTQCDNHSDTPAVANCDRCGKPVCALCLLEAAQGTFCSSDCMGATAQQAAPKATSGGRPAPAVSGKAEQAALQGKPVFKFKEPARTNKAGLIAICAVFAVVIPVGCYYSYKAFAPESVPDPNPPIVNTPDPVLDPRPVDPRPVDPRPVDPRPADPPPVVAKNPDPEPVERNPDATPKGVILRSRPAPKAVPVRVLNPWSEERPGSWYRLRTTAGGKTTYTDIGLKEKTSGSYVLATASSDGQTGEKKVDAPTVFLRGEQTFTFEGREFLCETQTASMEKDAAKTAVLISSKYPGAVFKSDAADAPFTATKVWEYTSRVKNRSFDCLVVEGLLAKQPVKTYYAALPIHMIRQEKAGESTVLVDFGDDWAKRPAFPK
ncbi:MAG: hypothetical protein JO332_10715 [Planctomycetaceae bacterium]|nr:hypothetical protein [Planctomycetaceae bacterium]